jgi:hypothetical protein
MELEIDPAQENPQVLNSNQNFIGFAVIRKSFDAIRVTIHYPWTPGLAENPVTHRSLSDENLAGGPESVNFTDFETSIENVDSGPSTAFRISRQMV